MYHSNKTEFDNFIMASWWWAVVAGTTTAAVFILRRFSSSSIICPSKRLMYGKTVLITGANSGIGKATALEMARRNAKVILACRDIEKGMKAISDIRRKTDGGALSVKALDLASFASVRRFCDEIMAEEKRLDVLVNNAAVMGHPYTITGDGIEINMETNHFGNFLLINCLLDLMKKSAPSRIVFVSSSLHKRGTIDFDLIKSPKEESFNVKTAYADSKLANVLFARELSRHLDGTSIGVLTVHPGMVRTSLGRHVMSRLLQIALAPLGYLLIKSPSSGCQTVVYCAVSEDLEGKSGGYYGNCKEEPWTESSKDENAAKKLWELSESLTATRWNTQ